MTEMRKRRKAAKLTLEELARKSGVNLSTLQALEKGRGKGYNIEYKVAIATALAVDFFKLWPEEKKRTQSIRKIIEQAGEGRR